MDQSGAVSLVMIGCGNFAHYYHVPALEADAGVTLAAILDPTPSEQTRALAKRNGAVLVAGLDGLPSLSTPTMAIVTTPHALHAGHIAAALNNGWHVLCDKPFVIKTSEARSLAADAARRNLVNAVAFNRRFDRGCLKARDLIRSGGIGQVRYVETVQLGYPDSGWFADPVLAGGGPFTGRGTHMADIVPWLIDRRPDRVRGRVRGGSATTIDEGGFIELRFGDLECHMTCLKEGWNMWDEVRIFGEDGLIELRRPFKFPIGWEFTARSHRGEVIAIVEADPNPGAATTNFVAAVRGEATVGCSFADAIVPTAIIEQSFISARDGGAWRDLE
jgi:predicted dehydrogenase